MTVMNYHVGTISGLHMNPAVIDIFQPCHGCGVVVEHGAAVELVYLLRDFCQEKEVLSELYW